MKIVCLTQLLVMGLTGMLSARERRPFALADEPTAQSTALESIEAEITSWDLPADIPRRRTQWLMFTADWCVPCQTARSDFESWLRRSGWTVDEAPEAHIRIVDADRQSDLVQQHNIRAFPTFVLMQDDRELSRYQGYPGRSALVQRFEHAVQTAPPTVGAISVGTLKGQRDNIANLIATFKPLLGTDGSVIIELDRPGTPTAVLPLGDRLSIRTDSPLVMKYTLKDDVLTCRFSAPFPRGRFTFGLPVEQPVSAVTLSVTEMVIELPHAPDVRLRVEP